MVKKVGKYEMGKTLGEGTFGKVKYAVNAETNEAVAIKVLDKEKIQKQNMGNQIKKEISIMKMVKHKFVVGMIEVLASKTKIFIVLELVSGGELFDKIVSVGKLAEEQARYYFRQLVEGVEYCHKLGVCHRDLKPENLLLDENGNLKISDFGLSSLYVGDANSDGATRTQLLHTTCGTPNYVAPEVLADQGYDGKKADVWSIGVILYVLLAGFLPFDESTIVALFAKIQNADFTYPSWFTLEVRSLLDTMLVNDPKVRSSLTQVANHPWTTSGAEDSSLSTGGSNISDIIPTIGDLDKAVGTVKGEMQSTSGDAHFDGEDDEDDDHGTMSSRGPKTLNAFELVNQCGGFLLDRMFSTEVFLNNNKIMSSSMSNLLHRTVSAGKLFGNTARSRINHFTSSLSAVDLIAAVYEALKDLKCTMTNSIDAASLSGKTYITKITPKGMITMYAQTFAICSTLSLLTIRRGKGDLMEFNTLYRELIDKAIAGVIRRPEEGETKNDQ